MCYAMQKPVLSYVTTNYRGKSQRENTKEFKDKLIGTIPILLHSNYCLRPMFCVTQLLYLFFIIYQRMTEDLQAVEEMLRVLKIGGEAMLNVRSVEIKQEDNRIWFRV